MFRLLILRFAAAAVCAGLITTAVPAWSQTVGTVGTTGTPGTTGTTGTPGTTGTTGTAGGIMIDAQGVVTPVYRPVRSQKLEQRRLEALAKTTLSADVNSASPMRKISLVKLEAAFEEFAHDPASVPAEMANLAGLQRIDFVFLDPDNRDLIIAGPAEGFAPDGVGRMVGVSTGRPPLRLDDLMVALRSQQRGGGIGCSIDPDEQRLAQLQRYVQQNSTPATRPVIMARFQQMRSILGMQSVRTWGVPADSHFAAALVEADYRMKRISMAIEPAAVRGFRPHLMMLRPGGNSMQRWWFTPLYEAIYTTADENAWELAGQRAQLLSQEEYVSASGKRSDAGTTRISTTAYAKHFTEKFPDLADEVSIFGELQNLIDLAIVAALLKKERLPQKIDWEMALFLDSERARIPENNVPRQVDSIVNFKSAGRKMTLGLVGGGVMLNPMETLRRIEPQVEEARRLDGKRTGAGSATDRSARSSTPRPPAEAGGTPSERSAMPDPVPKPVARGHRQRSPTRRSRGPPAGRHRRG